MTCWRSCSPPRSDGARPPPARSSRPTGRQAQGAFGVRARLERARSSLDPEPGGADRRGPVGQRRPARGRQSSVPAVTVAAAGSVFRSPRRGRRDPCRRPRGPSAGRRRASPAAAAAGIDSGLQALLDQAAAREASDLLLSAGARAFLRIDGELMEGRGGRDLGAGAAGVLPAVPGGRERCAASRPPATWTSAFRTARATPSEPLRVRGTCSVTLSGVAAALRPLRRDPHPGRAAAAGDAGRAVRAAPRAGAGHRGQPARASRPPWPRCSST